MVPASAFAFVSDLTIEAVRKGTAVVQGRLAFVHQRCALSSGSLALVLGFVDRRRRTSALVPDWFVFAHRVRSTVVKSGIETFVHN